MDLAEKEARKAKELYPTAKHSVHSVDSWLAKVLACRAFVLHDYNENRSAAIEHLKKAIEVDKNSAPIHSLLADIYAELGKKDEAVIHARRCVEIDPDYLEYRERLDRLQSTSSAAMTVAAFHGSWKVLLVIITLAAASTIAGVAGIVRTGDPTLLVFVPLWLVIAFGYWRWKSR